MTRVKRYNRAVGDLVALRNEIKEAYVCGRPTLVGDVLGAIEGFILPGRKIAQARTILAQMDIDDIAPAGVKPGETGAGGE